MPNFTDLPTQVVNMRDGGDIETITWAPNPTGDMHFVDIAGHRVGVHTAGTGEAIVIGINTDGTATAAIPTVHDGWTAALMSIGYVAVSDQIIVIA